MKRGCDKKGLSQVVSALLIILLVIVLIVIVWLSVKNVLEKQGEGVFLEKVTINLDITKAKRINDTNINVSLKREIGRGEIYGVYFVVYDKNSSEVMKYPVSMKELQEKNFEISLYVLNASKAEKIAVAPIFQIDSGKEIIGEIKDEYIIGKGGSSGIINPGCTQDSECTDPNLCTVDRCSNGVCLHTPMICNDNDACTDDLCSSGTCTSTPIICSLAHSTSVCSNGNCVISSCNSGWGNCNGLTLDGCETNILTNISNCGSCGSVCSLAHATSVCSSGSCGILLCATGWRDCNSLTLDGCETNILTNISNCGSCGNNCLFQHVNPVCTNGVCSASSCATGWGNCDGIISNGCETNLLTNISNCGSCGSVCSLAHATSACSNGNCGIVLCASGWGNCDGVTSNGCETPLNSVSNCGSCGNTCSLAHATSSCSSGSCVISSCATGWGNCDGVTSNGCETNLLTNISNCGNCGNNCSLAHATSSCSNGNCAISSCNSGWSNCNGLTLDGCETNIFINMSHCGSCGSVCSLAHATSACSSGTCTILLCASGWNNCNAWTLDGCETNILTNISNCGSCGNNCSLQHVNPVCTNGVCSSSSCATGWGNCDGVTSNGCETNLLTNISNCGSCGSVCSLAHATSSCSNGNCGIVLCASGWGNCDGVTSNGCETPLNSVSNCGSCGNTCSLAHATSSCSNGNCVISSCATGWGNCNGLTLDGCETNILTNISNCGSCGNTCSLAHATSACSSGSCVISSCATGWSNCNSLTLDGCETNILTNISHCGSCGSVCSLAHATSSCSSGSCVISSCNSGWGNCNGLTLDGCETNLLTNISNCGSCGNNCLFQHVNPVCTNGVCSSSSCATGWGNCDGVTSNGCETNLLTNISNCGSCGSLCSLAHATSSCSNGNCGIVLCATGWGNCNGVTLDGCETNLLTSSTNCGSCGNTCSLAHATSSCSNGNCVISSCATGWSNCNSLTLDGCETNILTNISHCGSCGNTCSLAHATSSCSSGSCVISSCATGWGNCDGVTSNGCETNLLTNSTRCGSCGNNCLLTNPNSVCINGVCVNNPPATGAIIANHNAVKDFNIIPECWIQEAKEQLVIGYGHTSHGSQITSGMTGFNTFMNNLGSTPNLFAWNNGGLNGALDLEEGAGYGEGWLGYDCGYTSWYDETRYYLNGNDPGAGTADHSDVNVIMWSWCGQVNDVNVQTHYLDRMALLENEYPEVTFVYMTGHLEGYITGHAWFNNNNAIRNWVQADNSRVLFDFADIEKYDPEQLVNYADYAADDACAYDSNADGTRESNWAINWQNSHTQGVDWYSVSCAHSQSLNCNQKAKAFWWMAARMAGWDGTAGDACP